MDRRRLGQGGPSVASLALGTMNFCGTYGPTDPETALGTLAEAVEMGVDHLDCADVYGGGRAEELLARFLRGRRDRLVIASKAGITRQAERPFDNSPDYLRRALEGSLRRLGVDHIDLYYIHRREASRPIEDVMQTLMRFREAGKIGAIGLSEVAPATLERALTVGPVAAVQSEYSLWTRLPELGLVQATARHGVALVAFSPLGRGALTGQLPDPGHFSAGDLRANMPRFDARNWPRNRAILTAFQDLAAQMGHDPASLAIAWVLARAPHVIALPGSRSAAHVAQAVAGADLRLSDADLARIDAVLPPGFAHGPRYAPALVQGPESYC